MNTKERDGVPTWCPDQQIYIGGVVPDSADVQDLINANGGRLLLFGYGSLCWNPGAGALAKPGVTATPGRARGYKRCWAQKSADHRGTTRFPGVVCTLLRDEEVAEITKRHHEDAPTMTEGLLYSVPAELVEECLSELDFREKGVRLFLEKKHGKEALVCLYSQSALSPRFVVGVRTRGY
jgi:cation transport regulator ChaC